MSNSFRCPCCGHRVKKDQYVRRQAENPRPADHSTLCWWLPTYRRRDHSAS